MENNASFRSQQLPNKKLTQCQILDTSPKIVSQGIPKMSPNNTGYYYGSWWPKTLIVRPSLLKTPHTWPQNLKRAGTELEAPSWTAGFHTVESCNGAAESVIVGLCCQRDTNLSHLGKASNRLASGHFSIVQWCRWYPSTMCTIWRLPGRPALDKKGNSSWAWGQVSRQYFSMVSASVSALSSCLSVPW